MKDFHPIRLAIGEEERLETFKQSRIFPELDAGVAKELAALSVAVRYDKGDIIFLDGNPADFLYIVHSGYAKLYKGASSGKPLTFSISCKGDTLNGLALSLDNYFMTAQAMGHLVLLRVRRKDYSAIVEENPGIAIQLLAVLAETVSREYDRMVNTTGELIEHRLAHSLLVLVRKFGPQLPFTREELADFAGTTTETTIRVLSKLKKEGVIGNSVSRREILVSNIEKLKEYARV